MSAVLLAIVAASSLVVCLLGLAWSVVYWRQMRALKVQCHVVAAVRPDALRAWLDAHREQEAYDPDIATHVVRRTPRGVQP